MTDTTNMVPLELLDGTVEYIRADGHSPLRVFAIRPSQMDPDHPPHLRLGAACIHGSRTARILCPPVWGRYGRALIRYDGGSREAAWVNTYFLKAGAKPIRCPGQKTLYTLHSGAHSSRYTGADLRQLNAERGVGRPPRKPSKRKI